MTAPPRWQRLLDETAAAAARAGQPPPGGDRPAEPGDLYVLPATAAFPVEWLVVEPPVREPQAGDPERLYAVAADTAPFAGALDVEVPASAAAGPLAVRCRFGAWLTDRDLAQGHRTGRLDLQTLGAVAEQVHRLRAEPAMAAAEAEADDPELAAWLCGTVAPALAALVGGQATVPPRPATRRPRPVRAPRSWRFPRSLAAVLFFSVLALGAVAVWQAQRVRELTRAQERAAAALRRSQDETAAVRQAGAADRRRLSELASQLAALEREHPRGEQPPGASSPGAADLPFVFLQPEETLRGGATPPALTVGPSAPYVAIILGLPEGAPVYPEYRLEIRREGARGASWTSGSLHATPTGEVSAGLPATLLEPGTYLVSLSGVGNGRPVAAGAYRMRVVHAVVDPAPSRR